ncbi:MAG: hypothetical protein ACRDTA_04545 [Pseudonocardiaceae bacterium]
MSLPGAFDVLRLAVVTVDTRRSPVRSDRGVVAVAVLDGFYGCGSGAGWSNRALMEILAEVLPVEIDLVVLPVRADAVGSGWQREWRCVVEEVLGRSGRRVEVRALEGIRGRPSRHGDQALTGAVEREIARLRGEYRRGLIVLCDVEFSDAAARSSADSAWTTVIVPRTSALLVQPELIERVAWERESLRRAAERGVRIAAISGYMRSHLTEQIGVPASAVVDLRNGVSGVDAGLKAVGVADLSPAARDGFWLAMGRDVVFVPAGWRHTVLAQSVEGLAYLTVNSFVPGADRIGASAVAHAMAVQPSFQAHGRAPRAAHAEPLAVFRSAETAFRVDEDGRRMWPRDFTALDTTLRRDPSTYRVRRVGPFEYVKPVTAKPRILTAELADRLFAAASGHLPVLVEGSQSPISVKAPCAESDLDILVAVESGDDLTLARKVLDGLAEQMDHVPVPLSLGVVHARWLDLPNFYSALSLDPAVTAAPDQKCVPAGHPKMTV